MNDIKVEIQAKKREHKYAKKEYEERKQKVCDTDTESESPNKNEIRKLKEEIIKLRTINKSRDSTSEELDKTTTELSNKSSEVKLLTNELNGAKNIGKLLESKLVESTAKLAEMEKKYAEIQEKLKEEQLLKEKSKVDLEIKIEELSYQLRNITVEDEEKDEERTSVETAIECQSSLCEIKEKISSLLEGNDNDNYLMEELNNAKQTLKELTKKYDEEIKEINRSQENDLAKLRQKHSKEIKAKKDEYSKEIDELELQTMEFEEQEGKAAIGGQNTKILQAQIQQLQTSIEAVKVQVGLMAIEYKSLEDTIENNEAKIQKLTGELTNFSI